jgi:hypothetical protein
MLDDTMESHEDYDRVWSDEKEGDSNSPKQKPGARECLQMSRRWGANVIPQDEVDALMDYCSSGKIENLIRIRERLDEHSRFLELQLSGLEAAVQEKGESDVKVPAML